MLEPETETDLAETVASATAPLTIRGGGTRPVGRPVDGAPLTVAKLSGITLHEPGALTLVARAGTPLAEIEAALAAEGQMLAFEPMDHRTLLGTTGEPTIGGVAAANVSGPRRVQAGACRDFLLGVRFVDGTGSIVKNGGRVMKNVTGYDLVKLMAGARGTLGILTEVSLKVLPKPEATAVLLLAGLSVADAVRAMSSALGSPFEVSAAAHMPAGIDGDPVTMIRVEGLEASVAYRAERLKDRLAEIGPTEIETRAGEGGVEGTEAGWRWVRDAEAFAGKSLVTRVSVEPGDATELIERLAGTFAFDTLLDWGGGLVWIGADADQLTANADAARGHEGLEGTDRGAAALHAAIQGHVARLVGHATLVKASDAVRSAVPVFQPEPAPLAKVSEGLRRRFDPRGILNPGLMG